MQSATPEQFYPGEEIQVNGDCDGNDHHSDEVSQPLPSLPECHQRIAQLKGKLVLMEEALCDYEIKLQVQEDARIASDFEKKKAREGYEQRIQHYERRISDMTLHIRTRDTQFLKAQEKNRILERDLKTMQLKKHEMIQQAKREVREAMRREIDRERASLDTKHQSGNMTSGSHDHAFGNGATPSRAGVRGDIRRQPTSGAMFMKAFAGQAPVGSGVRGSELKQTDQLREACVESSLNDFFQLQL